MAVKRAASATRAARVTHETEFRDNGSRGNGHVAGGDNYTAEQLRPLLQALRAAKEGDFSVRMPVFQNGVLSEIYQAFNDVVTRNENMAQEIVRMGRIVGREGKMTERASLDGASGSWATSIDSINSLIEDLARPTTEVARVITAVAEGDLTQKMALEIEGTPVKGEFLRIGKTVNTMVDQLSSFADEVTRVAREVGTEGKLGGQAQVRGVSGTWKDLTDSVNVLAGNLTDQVRNIALVTTAVANGDLSQKITVDARGEISELKNTINVMVDQLNSFAAEVTRVAREVGTEGILGGQAEVRGVSGTWKDLTDSVNSLAGNLTDQVRNIALVTTAVAKGDLSQKITVEARGEISELKNTINVMVDQLNSFAAEVTRVAREVGTEGILGGQADVPAVAGTWKDLTDNVNFMASNLTTQVRGIAKVVTAVADGDLQQKLVLEAKGEVAALAETINSMIDTLSIFAEQVTTVAREVGTEGKLGGQADVPNVAGTWKDLTDNVNLLAGNLTVQLRDVSKVATAIANGDLTQKIMVDVSGEILQIKNVINGMVDSLSTFAGEVTRVAREVGTEGILGGQAEVSGVSGTWKDLTDNVNFMAGNLTDQVRNIALVTTAVANGDLSQKITVDARGEIQELKNTINVMVDQLNSFAAEVTRVAREVGTEGILGGQAEVSGVAGTWKDLTDSVNGLAGNLTDQVRNIALVTTAVANGDLSKQITVDVKGEVGELKNTINVMVDQLNSFAAEVTRVAREVGTEGILGGQAEVRGVSGTWKDLTDNVNFMASNLTTQVRGIAKVVTAVADGDLEQKLVLEAKGEVAALAETINSMIDTLSIFAEQVTTVAREVGTDGILGGQAKVPRAAGTWKDLTDNVNGLAGNLTDQVRNIALVTTAVANGDLSKKITVDAKGEVGELKNTINVMVDQLNSFAAEVTRVAREVGTEGILGGQAEVRGVAGTWKDLTDNVNFMASNLTTQVRGIAKVVTAVADGDLEQKLVLEAKGEVAALADTINSMTATLSIFAEQVTTVARDVGTEGILGGQAKVPNAAGTWKDLTDNVNFMASNLTTQVRGIAKVVTAVANGNLKQQLVVEAKGEVAALAETINSMIDTLSIFAEQVTTVARDVGTEGILGGQAKVPNAAGTWKDLTDNVNFMANSLTTQVRAISEVATAVAQGDLNRSITVEAQGEVSALKNNINQMIANLKDTTSKNEEQDWLKTNLARFSSMMQGQKNLESVSGLLMSELTPLVSAHQGVFYVNDGGAKETVLKLMSSYAYKERKNVSNRFRPGEGLVGQCALEKKSILLTSVPGDYIQISSGLGEAPPLNIIVLPVLFEGELMAVIELASFKEFSDIHMMFLDQLMESIGVVLNMITANMRTEELLVQSQSLTQELQSQSKELQSQQDQLKRTNNELEAQARELEEKASLLAEQNMAVELKNREVELARTALEEKAQQLSLSSKYKSEFLANMSHELRTPLNSMLILAKLLADNPEKNLSQKQVEFANTIHGSGGDLLNLINEILDLSKVEAGKMEIEVTDTPLSELELYINRQFSQLAAQQGLDFRVIVEPNTPEMIRTDQGRLQQVLKNLLSNAFKFTEEGSVELRIARGQQGVLDERRLGPGNQVLTFTVRDTGIGIPPEKQQIIFEAFQQADGTTSRRYGGTGLGLSISREITNLLGGRIRVTSEPGQGSTFMLYLPQFYMGPTDSTGLASLDGANLVTPNGAGSAYNRGGTGSSNGAAALTASPVAGAGSLLLNSGTHTAGVADRAAIVDTGVPASTGAAVNGSVTAHSSSGAQAADDLEKALHQNLLADDRDNISPGDHVLLIVEDDEGFARIVLDMARDKGFKGIVAMRGDVGMELAQRYQPDAITLDLQLPVMDGWTLLDHLKRESTTRHIPVEVISVAERQQGTLVEAIAYLEKPATTEAIEGALTHMQDFIKRQVKDLLVVEDDESQRMGIVELIGNMDVHTDAVATGQAALDALETGNYDCMILDLGLPDMEGFEVLKKMRSQERYKEIPVVIYTSKDLTRREETHLKKYAQAIITKNLQSPDQLLDATALFMHRVVAKLPDSKRLILEARSRAKAAGSEPPSNPRESGAAITVPSVAGSTAAAGAETAVMDRAPAPPGGSAKAARGKRKSTTGNEESTTAEVSDEAETGDVDAAPGDLSSYRVLIVDDDVRNVFALTSVLENQGLQVLYAENGRDCLGTLRSQTNVDLVLMDVMMPEMDGYETMQTIRSMAGYSKLPIIALTAKAMTGDREKCISAGATEYITKPVDVDLLLSMIRKYVAGGGGNRHGE